MAEEEENTANSSSFDVDVAAMAEGEVRGGMAEVSRPSDTTGATSVVDEEMAMAVALCGAPKSPKSSSSSAWTGCVASLTSSGAKSSVGGGIVVAAAVPAPLGTTETISSVLLLLSVWSTTLSAASDVALDSAEAKAEED